MDVSLRSLVPADYPAILALSRRALAREEEQVGSPLWATMSELEDELVAWPGGTGETLRVLEEEGQAVAFGGIKLEGHATIAGPLVTPASRGRKIGSHLIEESIGLARSLGRDWAVASVGARNRHAQLLLERHGFRLVEGVDAVYRLHAENYRPAGELPEGVEIQRGSAADLDAIYPLYRESFAPAGRARPVWESWLERGEVYVAESADGPVGFLHIEPSARWISHLGVSEDAQGRGIGAALVGHVLADYWREHPGQELRLAARLENTPAIRLYRRLGFAPWLVLETFELEL